MKRLLGICLVGALAVAGGAFAAEPQPLAKALEIYGRLPSMEGATLSPSGNRLAVIRTEGDSRIIQVVDFAQGKQLSTANVGTNKVRNISWVDEDNLIILTTKTMVLNGSGTRRSDYPIAALYNVTSTQVRPLLQTGSTELERSHGGSGAAISGMVTGSPVVRMINGKRTVFITGVGYEGAAVFRIEPRNGATTKVAESDPTAADFLLGPEGQLLAQSLYDEVTEKGSLRFSTPTGRVNSPLPADAKGAVSLLGLTADGKAYLVGYETEKKNVVAEITPGSSEYKPRPEFEGNNSPIFDALTGRLSGVGALNADTYSRTYYDPAEQAAWAAVRSAFPKDIVLPASRSEDHSKTLVSVDSPTEGQKYFLIDRANNQALPIGPSYMGLTPAQVFPVRALRYKAADGTEITGYLTLPANAGASPRNLPLVALVHGGPQARDEPGFDWWSQAMASRGYAVMRVNYRGSDGFGREFVELGHKQWGRKMQTDVSDGVRALAKQGVIDPARVCVVGASYGGYAALAGAALDTGVYRCAASVAGPSDLGKMVAWSRDEKGRGALKYWVKFMGLTGPGDPKGAEISPAAHASAVTIPLLMIHGKDDTVVPYEQTTYMANAMRAAGKPYEVVTLDGEDHWLSRSATRLKMLATIEAFLEKNNPPG
jgi:dipeptidyl aminopeptidase/acylaminoacyl peptidase